MTGALRAAGAPVRLVLVGLIGAYRVTIGRLASGRCRFHPSCSRYAVDAIQVHGAAKGVLLAMWRVVRCSPLSAGGVEAVPPRGRWRTVYDDVIQSEVARP